MTNIDDQDIGPGQPSLSPGSTIRSTRWAAQVIALAAVSLSVAAIPTTANAATPECPAGTDQVCLYSSGTEVAAYRDSTSDWQGFSGPHRLDRDRVVNSFDATRDPHVAYFRHGGVTSCVEPGRDASLLIPGYASADAIQIVKGANCYPAASALHPSTPSSAGNGTDRTTPANLTLSSSGASFIASHEGSHTAPYPDPNGNCTVGVGHLLHTGACTSNDKAVSQSTAVSLLQSDSQSAQQAIRTGLASTLLSQPEFDALVDFTFNVGSDGFSSSTLRNDLAAAPPRYGSAPADFALWNGDRLCGIYRRRIDEGNLFSKSSYSLSTASCPAAGTPSGTAAQFAQQILNLKAGGKIRIADYSEQPSKDSADRSLASQQLQDIAAGKPAHLSTRCFPAGQTPAPVQPDVQELKFLADLGQQSNYILNTLFGQCHTSSTSLHYKGKAADFACGLNTGTSDHVGANYGVKRNFETCSANRHWHYSVGGN